MSTAFSLLFACFAPWLGRDAFHRVPNWMNYGKLGTRWNASLPAWVLALVGGLVVALDSASAAAASNARPGFLAVAQEQFGRWDTNHDGVLSPGELDALAASPQVTNRAAAAVAALKRAARSRTFKLPELTLENLAVLSTNKPAAGQPNLERMYREGLSRLARNSRDELFASGPPQLETIHQGRLGNCFCLAPLGAMVHRNPGQVAAMFAVQADGTYRVQLGKHSVVVAPLTDTERALGASNEQNGVWVNVYEKAVGQARNEQRPPAQRVSLALDAVARGGSAGTTLGFITGHDIQRFSFKFAHDPALTPEQREAKLKDLSGKLAAATAAKGLMTCGTVQPTTPGLTPHHAYAVLAYDGEKDAVTLWNPHGGSFTPKGEPGLEHGYPQKDGIFQMPLRHFVQQFSGMAFEVVAAPAP